MRKSTMLIAAAGLATAAIAAVPDAEARPWGRGGGWGGGWGGGHRVGWHGGYYRHRPWGWGGGYRRGWGGGGVLAAGLAGAVIGGAIASSYATPAYAYGYPAYYPSYGYGYPVQTVQYVETAPVVVRRRVVYRAPVYRSVAVRRVYRHGPAVAVYRPRAHFYRPARYRQTVVYGGRPGFHRAAVRYRGVRTY